jgi:hypothetical protein
MGKKSKLAKVGAGIAAAYLASKMGDSDAVTANKNLDYEYDAYKGASKKSSTTPFEHEGSVMPSKKTATASVRKKMQPGPKSINVSGVRNFGFGNMGFKSGGAVTTKGQGRAIRSKKTILLT